MRVLAEDSNVARMFVYLNGIELEHVVAVDTDERWIERVVVDSKGNPCFNGLEFVIERIKVAKEARLQVKYV